MEAGGVSRREPGDADPTKRSRKSRCQETRVPCVVGPRGVVPAFPHWTRRWSHLAQGHCLAVRWLRQRTIDDRLPLETPTTQALACSRSSREGPVRRACRTRGASWGASLRTRELHFEETLNRSATTSQVTSRSGHAPPAPTTQKDRRSVVRIEEEGAVDLRLPPEVPRRQPEQRWFLVENGAEPPPCRRTEKRKQAWGDLVETRLSNLILGPEKGVT